jgi:hypothetical protein
MATKFKGSIDELKAHLDAASIGGKWSGEGQAKWSFRSDDGGILNRWPSTGTIQAQGKEDARAALARIEFSIGTGGGLHLPSPLLADLRSLRTSQTFLSEDLVFA